MEKIKVSNFRKVKDTWDLDLAPITFFTGKNNSGKSSILKALMVLSDFGNSRNHFELNFNGENKEEHKIQDYSNAINWNNNKKSNLEFNFLREGYSFKLIFRPKVNPYYSKLNEDHFSVGELVLMRILRIQDNALLEIFLNNGECQINIDENYFDQKFGNVDFNNLEMKQLSQALAGVKNELNEIESSIKDKLLNNPNLLSLLGISGGMTAIASASLGALVASPLLLAGLGVAGGAKLLSSIKGRELIDQKKKAERLLNRKKKIEKRIDALNAYNKIRDKEVNILRPKFDLNEISNIDFEIDKILKSQLVQYLQTKEKELGKSNGREDISAVHSFAENILSSLRFNIFHLSPNRNRQTRLYINRHGDSDINEILEKYSETPLLEDSEEKKFLLKWLRNFEIGSDYKVSNISGQANTVEIFDVEEGGKENSKSDGRWVDLVDKGFGAGQLFTILLQIAMASADLQGKESPLLLIEEPESNLHPKLQSELAELFLDAYSSLGVRFIIETHSEYIIRKTQLLGLENNFFSKNNQEKNPFKLYYFDTDGPYEMKYTSQGKFEKDFGKGFYDEASRMSLEQIKLIRKSN